jgi:hypothetical protein
LKKAVAFVAVHVHRRRSKRLTSSIMATKPSTPPSATLTRVVDKLPLWMRKLMFGHLRIKRADKGMKLTFAETVFAASNARPGVQGADGQGPADAPARMRAELAQVLDARANNRQALAHLALLDKHLHTSGMAVFDRMPAKLLAKAHEQLLLVSTVHEDVTRGDLMSALSQALSRRKDEDIGANNNNQRELVYGGGVLVEDGRLSDFLQVHQDA